MIKTSPVSSHFVKLRVSIRVFMFSHRKEKNTCWRVLEPGFPSRNRVQRLPALTMTRRWAGALLRISLSAANTHETPVYLYSTKGIVTLCSKQKYKDTNRVINANTRMCYKWHLRVWADDLKHTSQWHRCYDSYLHEQVGPTLACRHSPRDEQPSSRTTCRTLRCDCVVIGQRKNSFFCFVLFLFVSRNWSLRTSLASPRPNCW